MLHFIAILMFASALTVVGQAQAPRSQSALAERVKAQRWQKRVVILCAPTAKSVELEQQKASLAAAAAQVQARDMLVLEAIETSLSAADKQYVRQTLGVASGGFALVLIGKDGGVKRKETRPIKPQALFDTIDTMPMRRQEMRDQGK